MNRAVIIGPTYDGQRMIEDPRAPIGERRWRHRIAHGVTAVVGLADGLTHWRVEGIAPLDVHHGALGRGPQKAANDAARAVRGFAKVIGGRA